jgi:hypothetical protein
MRQWINKIASATANVLIRRDARLSSAIVAKEGYIVAARILGDKTTYNELEDPHGRMVRLQGGDVIAGVLGHRNALRGYSGEVPESIQVGDLLQILNLGGVIGRCTSINSALGRPFDAEVLGSVLVFPEFESRAGVPAHIGMNAIPLAENPLPPLPVVFVAGTCMNSGKTTAACRLIRQLSQGGLAVGACKLTGVSLRRDALKMMDYGAQWAFTFTDAGVVSTTGQSSVAVTMALFAHLAEAGAEVIVAELGDGILGEYGVAEILENRELTASTAAIVLCSNDPVGTWGSQQIFRDRFNLEITVVTGPTTDNAVGIRYIESQLGLPAINARSNGVALGELVASVLAARSES